MRVPQFTIVFVALAGAATCMADSLVVRVSSGSSAEFVRVSSHGVSKSPAASATARGSGEGVRLDAREAANVRESLERVFFECGAPPRGRSRLPSGLDELKTVFGTSWNPEFRVHAIGMSDIALIATSGSKSVMLFDRRTRRAVVPPCPMSTIGFAIDSERGTAVVVSRRVESITFIDGKANLWSPNYSGTYEVHVFGGSQNSNRRTIEIDSEVVDIGVSTEGGIALLIRTGREPASGFFAWVRSRAGHPEETSNFEVAMFSSLGAPIWRKVVATRIVNGSASFVTGQ